MKRLAFPAALLIAVAASAEPSLSGRRIVLDPGHGTINFENQIINAGKNTQGTSEHSITMDISLLLGQILEEDGATVFFTRDREDYWREGYGPAEDNKARAYLANELNADAYICIHCDWHPSRRFQGVTTFYLTEKSRRLGEVIQQQLVRELKVYDRKLVHESFTVLDHADMPAVLVETGFMSHRTEGKKLLKPEYQKKIASALASALRLYFSQH